MRKSMKKKMGDMLLVLILLILIALFWIYAVRSIASRDTTETVSVKFEPVPITTELTMEVQQGEVYPRTHDIKVNEFTYEEAQLLMKVAQAEAGNQGTDGMWLVMSVIYNRRASDQFGDSIKKVVYAPHQFATVSNGAINRVEISPECHEALARIECGEVAPEIIGFETTDNTTLDKYFCSAFSYRDHQFYTLCK